MNHEHTPLLITVRLRAAEVERLTRPLFNDELTPQAIAAHKRSARSRELRHLKAWGLLAGVVDLPPGPTLEEHRARQREAAVEGMHRARKEWAEEWREARARLRALPPERARELLAEWNVPTRTGSKGPGALVSFIGYREPTRRVLDSRRQGRLNSARSNIGYARRNFTWYIAHPTCPEGDLGVAVPGLHGTRGIRCIACDRVWRTKLEVMTAEEAGDLEVVDCRLAEQLEFL